MKRRDSQISRGAFIFSTFLGSGLGAGAGSGSTLGISVKLTPVKRDIESVEIIKGEAAARLYGDRARDGVITIKTKKR